MAQVKAAKGQGFHIFVSFSILLCDSEGTKKKKAQMLPFLIKTFFKIASCSAFSHYYYAWTSVFRKNTIVKRLSNLVVALKMPLLCHTIQLWIIGGPQSTALSYIVFNRGFFLTILFLCQTSQRRYLKVKGTTKPNSSVRHPQVTAWAGLGFAQQLSLLFKVHAN